MQVLIHLIWVYRQRRHKRSFESPKQNDSSVISLGDERQGLLATATDEEVCSVGVVRPIISAFRADDTGSNPAPSTTANEFYESTKRTEKDLNHANASCTSVRNRVQIPHRALFS